MARPEVFLPTTSQSRAHLVVNSIVVFLVLIIVALRVVGRFMGPGLGWDDALVLFATPLGVVMLVCQGLFAPIGNGYNLAQNPELAANVPFILQLTFGMQLVYIILLASAKASMLLFYMRVFVNIWVQRSSQVLLFLVGLWAIAYVGACIFLCQPVSAQWTGQGKCGEYIQMIQSLIATNALGDLVIMILPMYSVWNLKMRKADKLGITASFGLGIACVLCAIFRLIHISTVDLQLNVTGTMPTTVFLFTLEPNLAILCISIPMLRPFYVLYRKRVGGSRLKEADNTASGFRDHGASNDGDLSGTSRSQQAGGNTWEMDDYYPSAKGAHHNTVRVSNLDQKVSRDDDKGLGLREGEIVVHTNVEVSFK